MRWWPWRRDQHDGQPAREAAAAAQRQLDETREQTERVDRTARAARQMARHVDQFARDVEWSLHLRGRA